MSEDRIGRRGRDANRQKGANTASPGAADWISLAATPTFTIMALLTVAGALGGPPDMHASPLTGMVPMYLMMSAFHSAPWLKRLSSRRGGVRTAR
jgi:hypothetical protein